MPDPYIGKSFGNITLSKELGAGGMGTVYLGHNATSKRDVAVKILRPVGDQSRERQYKERFLREIQVAARIQHENVVQVLDAGLQRDVVYLVMELIRGGSLGDRLDRERRIKPEELRRIGLAIAEGLAAIHSQGIVHRDIKPDNILLGTEGEVKITDLGLARQTDDESFKRLTVSGMVVGTPFYLAPEAIRDCRNAGPPSDIYSFGATLYHCLAGEPPFDAPGAYDVMRKHLEERYRPLREFDRSIPRYLIDLIDCCLDKDAEKRPSAGDCAQALKHGGRMRHEQRGLAFVAVILIGLLGAIAAVSWQVLNTGPSPTIHDRASSERNASVILGNQNGALRVRIDGGDWLDWRDGPWFLAPGDHRLEAEQLRDGALFAWQQGLTLGDNEERHYDIDLLPVYLSSPYPAKITLSIPEGHYLVYRGELLGWRKELHINQAGEYRIAHWNGSEAAERSITVYRDGSSDTSAWAPCNSPPNDTYLKNWHRGRRCPAHHVVSWWECEQSRGSLPTPPGWEQQVSHPEQAALGLDGNTAIIAALLAWRGPHGFALPSREQADDLARLYDRGIWYQEQGSYRITGGGMPSRALLVLVEAQ